MGLDMYIYKVKTPTDAQMKEVQKYSWEDLSDKTSLAAIAVDNFDFYPDHINQLVPYSKKTEINRTCLRYEDIYKHYGMNDREVTTVHHSKNGICFYLRTNEKEKREVFLSYEEVSKYETVIKQKVLVYEAEDVYYWRKAYDVQDYFYENFAVDNCKYVEISVEDLENIRECYDEDVPIPTLGEDEHLFYYEWY